MASTNRGYFFSGNLSHHFPHQAEKKWLEKLLQLAEDEVETLARGGCDGNEEQAAYEDFHRRWRKAARWDRVPGYLVNSVNWSQ